MNSSCEIVYLVSQELHARENISSLLASRQFDAVCFESAAGYLGYARQDQAACLIIDSDLQDCRDLDVQRLLASECCPPVIFICGRVDITCAVRAMKEGAIDVLAKPVETEVLAASVRIAFEKDRKRRNRSAELGDIRKHFDLLTPREQQVVPLIIGGMLNKQAAAALGIAEVTLQVHRSQIMRKMEAESFAHLVWMTGRLGISLRCEHFNMNRSTRSTTPPVHDQAPPLSRRRVASRAHKDAPQFFRLSMAAASRTGIASQTELQKHRIGQPFSFR